MKLFKTRNSNVLSTFTLVACVVLVFMSSCNSNGDKKQFDQTKLLSIEDAIRISNMDNMEEASAFLKEKGFEQAEDKAGSSPSVVSYWYKDCELYCGGIHCYNTLDVNSEEASSVAIYADGTDDVVNIKVYSDQAKEEYLSQIKSLGFKKIEIADKDGDFYANDSDTIRISHRPDKNYHEISICKERNWGYHEYGVEDFKEDLERQDISL